MASSSTRRFLWVLLFVTVTGCAGARAVTQPDEASSQNGEGSWITLFNGTSLEGWTMAGPGRFVPQENGTLSTQGGMGLFYYSARPFRDFVLELEWKASSDSANSGIFVRFPETDDPVYAAEHGYEIQIDGSDEQAVNLTGAVYDFSAPFKVAAKPAGQWNTYRIKVTGQRYQVFLNGEKVNDFFGERGLEGYIGLQNHDPSSKVWFRNVRVKPLPPKDYPESLADLFSVTEERAPIRVLMVTATHGFRHGPAIEKAKEVLTSLEKTTEFAFDMTEDVSDLNTSTLAQYDLLFFNNSTLRAKVSGRAGGGMAASPLREDLWRAYGFTLETPRGAMDGKVFLYGEPGELSGTIQFENGPAPGTLQDVQLQDSTLSFYFVVDQYGRIDVETALQGDTWDGTLTLTEQDLDPLPMKGEQLSSETLARAEATPVDSVGAAQKAAIMDFLQDGKGVVVTHAGLDAFYHWDAYREMVGGGLFKEHPWTQPVRIRVEEPANPAMKHLGEGFWIRDEIYVLDANPRWNAHVLASLDMNSVGVLQGYADGTRGDYPISWIRTHNGGRVFVTKLGHFADVWTTPFFLRHLLQGMRMAAGRIDADFSGHRVKEVLAKDVWPDDIAVDAHGNVWIAELRGEVHRYDAALDSTWQIAQIETTDPTKIEHGLYGIEVDPRFYEGEPYVYLYYAEPGTFINTLARFRYEEGTLDLSTKEVLLRVPTEPQCCHQAGDLEWGPEGKLFLSTGDTGMSETRPSWELTQEEIQAFMDRHDLKDYHWSRLVDSERSAQNLQDLRGKILRINKDGTIPKDNPFYGEAGIRWEIYAYGLRNPYRFKVDGKTGRVYIGVVGPDAGYDHDEYNVAIEGGENFGWPREIGGLFYNGITPEDIPNFMPPLWEYTYRTGGRSATVGPIYRSDGPYAFPDVFQGKVFIFDWARRWIKWADVEELTFESDSAASVKESPLDVEMRTPRFANIKTFDQLTTTAPISMELGPDGSLYVAEFAGFWDAAPEARVTRYRWISGDEPPIGKASVAPVEGHPLKMQFDASSSYDYNADHLAFHWAFGDGTTGEGPALVHTYAEAGAYAVRLTVTDSGGATDTVALKVVAGPSVARAEHGAGN